MKKSLLNVTSKKFGPEGIIPFEYAIDGKNVNPPILIKNLPKNAKSVVIIMEDAEKDDYESVHWLAYNIPATGLVKENEKNCQFGYNGFKGKSYVGPAYDGRAHRYVFRVYALDDLLHFSHENVSRLDVEEGIRYHIIGYGELRGKYLSEEKLEIVKLA